MIKNLIFALAMTSMPLAINAQTTATNANPAATNAAKATQNEKLPTVDLDARYATDLLKVGDEAPDFSLRSPNGETITLDDYRGKYVVLDFWASWCPDCRRDLPNIVAMYNRFKDKKVEFIGVSFDTKAESWKGAIKKFELKYTQASDLQSMRNSSVAAAYHIKWIPTTYVINPKGKVVLATVMSDKVAKYLDSVFPCCAE